MLHFCFLLFVQKLAAAEVLLKKIDINGNTKTNEEVILNELDIPLNQKVSSERIQQGIQNLRNIGIFSKVQHKVDNSTLRITVKEKWTTIPILKFSSGGGASQTILGVYDPNVQGHFFELGVQLEQLGDAESGVMWFKQPRLWGERQGLFLQAWSINRLRTKYDQQEDNPKIKTGFLQIRQKIFISYDKQISRKSKIETWYERHHDTFSEKLVSSEVLPFLSQTGLPENTKFHFAGVAGEYGEVSLNSFLIDGQIWRLQFRQAISETDTPNFSQFDLSWSYYRTSKWKSTFAHRVRLGATTTKTLQYWYYYGGLDAIRGFSDNRFSGRYSWLSNSEFRRPVLQRKNYVIQAIGFADLVGVSEGFQGFDTLSGASIGIGGRLILPQIYRFVLRIDYARPIVRNDDMNLSFGVQQFF